MLPPRRHVRSGDRIEGRDRDCIARWHTSPDHVKQSRDQPSATILAVSARRIGMIEHSGDMVNVEVSIPRPHEVKDCQNDGVLQ